MRNWLIAGMLLLLATSANTMELGGVQLPDTLALKDGSALQLNGGGLRTKLFFKIYAGGLYLQQDVNDGEAVIEDDGPALVRMHFIYDGISPEKMQETWREGFEQTAPQAGDELGEQIATFINTFDAEVKEGDIYDLSYQPQIGLSISRNNMELVVIKGLPFKKALFSIWFGTDPVDSDLKKGMLGGEK